MDNREYSVNNAPIFLNIIIFGLLTVIFAILQTTLMPRLQIFGVCADIVVAAVCCAGIYAGPNTAALFGLIAGLAVTSLGSVGVSIEPLCYVFVGYFCGRVGMNARYNTRAVAYFISMPLVCLAGAFVSFVNFHISYWGSIEYGRLFLRVLLPEFLYTLVISLPVFCVVRLLVIPIVKYRRDTY